MAFGALVKPQDALGSKHAFWQLVVQEILKLADGKGAIAGKGKRRKAING